MNSLVVSTDKNCLNHLGHLGVRHLSRGFTLIEILVVVAIISILGGLGMIYGLDNFRTHTFHSNRETLISALQHARSQAVSNICRGSCDDGLPHGVYIDEAGEQFVIFQGVNYDSNNIHNTYLEASSSTDYEGPIEIVFERLSSEIIRVDDVVVSYIDGPWEITLNDEISDRTATISINSEGQIEWKD